MGSAAATVSRYFRRLDFCGSTARSTPCQSSAMVMVVSVVRLPVSHPMKAALLKSEPNDGSQKTRFDSRSRKTASELHRKVRTKKPDRHPRHAQGLEEEVARRKRTRLCQLQL